MKRVCAVYVVSALLMSSTALRAQEQSGTTPSGSVEEPGAKESTGGVHLDSLSLGFGYSYALSSTTDTNGGIVGAQASQEHGWATQVGVFVAPGDLPELKFFLGFTRRNFSDRNFTQLGLGLRYDIWLARTFNIHLGAEASYAFLHWDAPPANNVASGVGGAESFGGGAHLGFDWYFIDNLGLFVDGRADFFGLDTTVVQGGATTQLADFGAISVLAGLSVRFNRPTAPPPPAPPACQCNCEAAQAPPSGDADHDGVVDAFDDCRDTLIGVLVGPRGCPLEHFTVELEFEYAEFSLSGVVNRPPFRVIAFLRKHPNYRVHITGHTDDVGSRKFNARLGRQRAEEARRFLLDHGINGSRVTLETAGKEERVVQDEQTEKDSARNRRIAVRFYSETSNAGTDQSAGGAPAEPGQ